MRQQKNEEDAIIIIVIMPCIRKKIQQQQIATTKHVDIHFTIFGMPMHTYFGNAEQWHNTRKKM